MEVTENDIQSAPSDSNNKCTRTNKVCPPYLILALGQWPLGSEKVKNRHTEKSKFFDLRN